MVEKLLITTNIIRVFLVPRIPCQSSSPQHVPRAHGSDTHATTRVMCHMSYAISYITHIASRRHADLPPPPARHRPDTNDLCPPSGPVRRPVSRVRPRSHEAREDPNDRYRGIYIPDARCYGPVPSYRVSPGVSAASVSSGKLRTISCPRRRVLQISTSSECETPRRKASTSGDRTLFFSFLCVSSTRY